MGKYTKWIGGALGWAFGGPIGGLFGFALGSIFDATSDKTRIGTTTNGDFIMSLLVLVAAMMKADGKILKSELNFVKSYFIRAFGPAKAQELVKMLGDLVKQEIPIADVLHQISTHMDYASRLELCHLLLGIALADGESNPDEMKLLKYIANTLGIEHSDYQSMLGMYGKQDSAAAYQVLGVTQEATNDEIKAAYRKLAIKYHPDKVSYLGEELVNSAKEKFQKINEAYNLIKKERKFA